MQSFRNFTPDTTQLRHPVSRSRSVVADMKGAASGDREATSSPRRFPRFPSRAGSAGGVVRPVQGDRRRITTPQAASGVDGEVRNARGAVRLRPDDLTAPDITIAQATTLAAAFRPICFCASISRPSSGANGLSGDRIGREGVGGGCAACGGDRPAGVGADVGVGVGYRGFEGVECGRAVQPGG